jgi:hypothetical protein
MIVFGISYFCILFKFNTDNGNNKNFKREDTPNW